MDFTVRGLINQMGLLTISDEKKTLLTLENYFPASFKIIDYNATENKIIKTSFLDDDIKQWLRKYQNKNFIFQCLLCCQEMTFSTVFLRGNYALNRSHLLTKKHIAKVKNTSCVGVLFASSQKFIMCLESIYNSGNIFNAMKTVRRKDELLINNLIKNKIFCSNYSVFTLDTKSKSLCEIDANSDIVQFMIENIRPLFSFHCLLCDTKSGNFTQVVNHLGGKKHLKKLKGTKGAIVTVRDFNVFVACNLNELTSFLILNHLNSYLEEIVIASGGSVVISGCHSSEGKPAPKDGGVNIDVNPIKLPNGNVAQESIKVTTRFNNFLTDLSDNELSSNELVTSRNNMQKNVTIYEYSDQDFQQHCMDNILYALFSIGCKIWCSRCRKGIFTLQALQTHLSSIEHRNNIRNNEQIGFMCHVCNIFFIELKGESLVHTHSSYLNKEIIRKLAESCPKHLEYNTPLNNSIIGAYEGLFNNIAEVCKFCCLACCDLTQQKLMYLGIHEISTRHKSLKRKLFFTYCIYCNVIYIDHELDQKLQQFKLHFAKHLDDSNGPITYKVYNTINDQSAYFSSSITVDNNFFTFRNIILQERTELLIGQSLTISFSQNFIQFNNPGVCSSEFVRCEKWNNCDISRYVQFFMDLTGKKVEFFECTICNLKKTTKTEIFKHLFVTEHQIKQLYMKECFLKICDICNLAIFAGSIKDLQQHFNHTSHITALCTITGLSFSAALTFYKPILNFLMNMSRSSLLEVIKKNTIEMNLTYEKRQKIFDSLTEDILSLMSHKFPNVSVTFYGSRLSGLATTESDFDIFLDIGNDYLNHVKELLATENNFFKFIVCIDCAVPIIQAQHKKTGYLCEFNLDNPGQHVCCSKIIKILTNLDERVLELLAAVKHWSIASKLRGTNMFSSHAITWLVLFYLMQPDVRIIPNISFVIDQCGDLQANDVKDCVIDWKPKINIKKNWLDLLEGFFNYYSLLKFSEYKFFPSSGLVVPRIQEAKEDERPIFMQDPLYKERNILYNATKEKCEKFNAACYLSLHMPWRLND